MPMGPVDLALEVAALLDDLSIPYVLGGSVASSLVGEPRATVDVDLAVRLQRAQVGALVAALGTAYYVSREAALEAVARSSSFNLIHLGSMQKVDLFVLGEGLLDRRQIERRERVVVAEDPRRELWVGSAEDQVLRKLAWFRLGGQISDRQWRDVVAILSVQADRVNYEDLRAAAAALGLADLLARAERQAASR